MKNQAKQLVKERKPGNFAFFEAPESEKDVKTAIGDEVVNKRISDVESSFVAKALKAAREGDFTMQLEPEVNCSAEIAAEYNGLMELLKNLQLEVGRIGNDVGMDGDFSERINLKSDEGSWGETSKTINELITNLANPTFEIARVVTAVANGDLSSKVKMELNGRLLKGEYFKIGEIANTMVDQLNAFSGEVIRVANEVGTEGILGGQAKVEGVSGTWQVLTNTVNDLAANLTSQVRSIAEVNTAVANGDLTKKIEIEVKGEVLELKNTVNKMVDQLNAFSGEVTRVAKEVGTDGILGGQAQVTGVAGTWKDLTENVNFMAANLTSQVRNIAEVNTAVAQGDLTKKITIEAKGEVLELKNTINVMVDQLNAFSGEVIRVANEVGTEGILGGQAKVEGVSGTWQVLTNTVNDLAANLTSQVRSIAEVNTAVANGDLTKKIEIEVKGEVLELKNTVNKMVDQLNAFSGEVTRVAKEVGTDGILGGQAQVTGVAGTWKDLTENVNFMAANLTSQVRNIAEVNTAVAQGDLTKKITIEAKGEILELKNTINTMVDQLNAFSGEVIRVANEVGTEGILGGQAKVEGVSGTWQVLTNTVNNLASNLTSQVRSIAEVNTAVANGDLTKKIDIEVKGEVLELKNTVNKMVDQLNAFSGEVTRVAKEVGTDGILGGQAQVTGVAGTWKDLTENVNFMAANLTSQVRNIAEVNTAVAQGDLTKKITIEAKGEILELKNTINVMVDQLNAFSGEVIRVANEVGTEGILGGQAKVEGVSGTWQVLTNTVNNLASNLTSQVRSIAEVNTAVANGDLTKKIDIEVKGEVLELKNTVNKMVDQLNAFSGEVTRVAKEVGTDGILGGQAQVTGVAGTWKDLTDNVNFMAANLTTQVRNIAEVNTAVAQGDLTKKITIEAKGEILELKNTINVMVDQLNAFSGEVIRVANEVGTEGILGGQAKVEGVSGTWQVLTNTVNDLAANLTSQVRSIAEVNTAVANGDLTKKIDIEVKGEVLELKNTVNKMVDQLNAFAGEVTRVAKEVGTDGMLGGQAQVAGVAGTWKDLTDNVNFMAANLTTQVRNIAEVNTAVANGDLTKKITIEAKGEILELKDTINVMVDKLNAFSGEVIRVATEVGTEGILGGQAKVEGVSGTWQVLTNTVNGLAANLTSQVRNIAEVNTAVAQGDLTKKITIEAKGEVLELKNTINVMVDQLNAFSSEVTRVAKEVGTDGILGGQAQIKGVSGTWKDLTDNVNFMAANLTTQVRNIAEVNTAVAQGDLTKKITIEAKGEILELKNTINVMVDQLNAFSGEVIRVANEVGTEGILGGQAKVEGVSGTWQVLTNTVNGLAANLTSQVRNIAEVNTAVAQGDLTKKITIEAKGEVLELKNTINVMVDQLNAFSSEVTRVAKEVGTDGILGGQAQIKGVSGTWKDLTDNVNFMAANLTTQVRNIAEVNTAVAQGDLTKKITIEAKGEILELKNTINVMVDQLNAFSGEVIRVANEVGTEGILGGQAKVEGVSGTWQVLTNTVNDLAANLTLQVRSIAEVNTAVANGDLTKKITIEVKGEVLELKNTVNKMVDQLNAFAGEVTRVAKEVGTDGMLGGQAQVAGVAGTWKNLTDNVNFMAASLTTQVRNIAEVISAVAVGDLSQKISIEAKGEILELKDTINVMVDQLNAFSSEVIRLAREVGVDGKLGSQAMVKGVEGKWKDLTDNVNLMASNLTDQVKDIDKVAKTLAESASGLAVVSKQMTEDSKETSAKAGEVSETSEEVNKNMIAVATSTEQMTSSIKEIAKNANEATKVAVEAVDMAAKTNVTVSKLGDSSIEIGNVIKLITSIAEQTNLLALNATIEAARAGEAGKGFAVVANEVKDLAKETASATEDISRKIEAIQNDTKSAVQVIGEITKIINQISDIQNTIATAVEEQTATTNEIAQNADKAAKGVSGITKNIVVVAKSSEDTTVGATNSQKAATELNDISNKLQGLVGRFTY